MKTKKIITGIISLALLSMQNVFAVEANNNFELTTLTNNGKELVVELNVSNPSNQQIASVQSWLTFDKTKLKGVDIDTEGSPFDFVIPGESDFEGNLVKIGRSTLGGDTAKEKVFVAKIKFNILNSGETEIKFYDYKTDDTGHVSIQVFDNGFPVNTLSGEPTSLKLNLSQSTSNNQFLGSSSDYGANNQNDFTGTQNQFDSELSRPGNLKITTQDSSATLKWDGISGAENYYLYYGKTSGRYLNRRLIGNVNLYKIDGLEIGKQYFFAVTGVSELNKESDYSDEVAITIGNPLTSTSPLIEVKNNSNLNNQGKINDNQNKNIYNSKTANINAAKENTKTGPAEVFAISLLLAFALTGFLMRNKLFI